MLSGRKLALREVKYTHVSAHTHTHTVLWGTRGWGATVILIHNKPDREYKEEGWEQSYSKQPA